MRRTPRYILAFVLAALCACGEESGDGAEGGRQDRATLVVTTNVRQQTIIDEIQALGTARANESIEIQPRIASLVDRVAFEEGQFVSKGDLLIELESSEIVAGLRLAEAELSESRSLYERSQSLASTQAISASNLDQLLAEVRVNEAQVEAARSRLANSVIRAPFSGRVGLRRVSPGSFVNTQTIITTLDDVDTIKLDFSVPETYLTVVSEGMSIVAKSVVFPDRSFAGTVSSIDTRLDPVSRAVSVRAVIPNDDGALKPGMFMTVDLKRDRGLVLVAPEEAIVPEGSSQFVFVVESGIVEKRRVELGRRIPGFVVISDGLEVGETIVTEGTQKIRAGSAIDVFNADAGQTDSPRAKE